MYVPGHDMNVCKVMQVQAKSMKDDWSSASGVGVHGNFKSTNNHSDNGEELRALVEFALAKALKIKKKSKVKTNENSNSDSDANSKYFNFENLDIGVEFD